MHLTTNSARFWNNGVDPARSVCDGVSERALIVLTATERDSDNAIAARLGTTCHRVARWRARFEPGGIEALKKDLPRGGRPPTISATKIKQFL